MALWRIVFLIAAVLFIVGDIIYIIYIETEVQEWNSNEKIDLKHKCKLTEIYIFCYNMIPVIFFNSSNSSNAAKHRIKDCL